MNWNIKYATSLIISIFCLFTLDYDNWKFLTLSVLLYSATVFFILSKKSWLNIAGIWTGIFLITQTILTPIVIDNNYKTLPANLNSKIDVKGGVVGVFGKHTITTDKKGFRTSKNIEYDASDSYRIFAIGASTTEEIILDDSLTWTSNLQAGLQAKTDLKIEVINTGVSGLRAEHHLSTLNNILKFNPDMVVFLVGINDWNWHIKNRESNLVLLKLDSIMESLVFSKTILGRALDNIYHSFHEKTFRGEDVNKEKIIEHNNRKGSMNRAKKILFKPDNVHDQYKLYLEKISETCASNQIQCIFITQPTGYSNDSDKIFRGSFWMTPPHAYGKKDVDYTLTLDSMIHISSLYNNFLIKTAKENGIQSCDLASKIEPSHENFYDDCHFNIKGSSKVAKYISSCISKEIFQ